jgi:uncharacterized membrane protein
VADTNAPPPIIQDHIEETLRSVSQLRDEHYENATPLQRAVEHTTAMLGRPLFIAVITVIVAGWICSNLLAAAHGVRAVDPPPFSWLEGAVSLVSLYMVVLILATQRREDQLAQRRELLLLELAVLSEQKTAKVIRLLEESRRDNPLIHNRHDAEAETMAQPADAQVVLDAIRETHASKRNKGG